MIRGREGREFTLELVIRTGNVWATHHLIVLGAGRQCEGALHFLDKQILVSGQQFGVFDVFVEEGQHLFPAVPKL